MNLLTYRLAVAGDSKLFFDWANDELVRKNAHHTEPIVWENHQRWFAGKLRSPCIVLVFFLGKIPVGQVRIEVEQGKGLIDYSVDRNFRGKGVGVQMLTVIKELIMKTRILTSLSGEVKADNTASIKVFEKAGFTQAQSKTVKGVFCHEFFFNFK